MSLLEEARRLGLAAPPSTEASEAALLAGLKAVSEAQLQSSAYPNEGELGALNERRREILPSSARCAAGRKRYAPR